MGELIRRPSFFRRGFILLEVMVAIVIVGIAMVALIRGFIISLDTLKKVKMNEQAILLAQSFMDDLVLEPPAEGEYTGAFTDDNRFGEEFEGWRWELEVEAEEPDYEERPSGKLPQDLEHLYIANITIYYEPELKSSRRSSDARTYIQLQTILMEPDIFSIPALQGNQLY